MKKISLIAALAVSTMLSACGGGGGGGHSFVPPATIPDTPGTDTPENKEKLTEMKTRLVTDSDKLTQLVLSTKGLKDFYSGVTQNQGRSRLFSLFSTPATARNGGCTTLLECNQQLIDTIDKILVKRDWEDATVEETRNALLAIGFTKDDIGDVWDDLPGMQNFIQVTDSIADKVTVFYEKYANLTMENAKLHLAALHESEQDSEIQFTLDENDEIDGITLKQNAGKKDELSYTLARDGGENKFDIKTPIYRYGINSPYYSGIYIESTTELLDPKEIQERLNKRVDELATTGVFDDSGEREQEVKNLKDAIAIIYGGKDASERSDMEVIQVTGDVREIDYDYQSGKPIPIELFELNYTKTETTDYQSYAKEMKLAYSDFGLLNRTSDKKYINNNGETQTDTLTEKIVFAGGYESKKVDAKDLAGDMTFKGRAVGGVNVLETDNHGDISNAVNKNLSLDGEATLSFNENSGAQTVKAEFDNWYDVMAETDNDGKTGKLTLTNGNKIADADFKFRGQDTYTVEDFTTAKQLLAEPDVPIDANLPDVETYLKNNGIVDYKGDPETHNEPAFGAMMIGYYGENNDPKEATGYVFYEEARGFNGEGLSQKEFVEKYGKGKIEDYYDRVRNTSVNFGFGAQRQ